MAWGSKHRLAALRRLTALRGKINCGTAPESLSRVARYIDWKTHHLSGNRHIADNSRSARSRKAGPDLCIRMSKLQLPLNFQVF
jgi:hypothetical protein